MDERPFLSQRKTGRDGECEADRLNEQDPRTEELIEDEATENLSGGE